MINRKKIGALISMTVAAASLAACEKGSPGSETGGEPAVEPTSAAASPAQGTRHDPPVEPEQLPEGTWYCDMGTVHYSCPDKGDGKCPVCHMKLKQKDAS